MAAWRILPADLGGKKADVSGIEGVIATIKLKSVRYCMVFFSLVLGILFIQAPIASAAEKEGRQAYYAELNDTVERIAFYFDLDSELVAAMNNTRPESRLREGQLLWLPLEPMSGVTVEPGDTLWSLAQKYQTSVIDLCELNDIRHSDFLRIGQVLQLPEQSEQGGQVKMVLARNEITSRGGDSFVWPVEGVISSAFGWRSRGWHCGLDIAANYGSTVRAVKSGIVTQAGWRSDAYGYAVMLDHGNNTETLYAHNSKVLVTQGQFVRQGQAIAEIGATGNATGAHVHLEVRLNSVCENPLEYLR